MRKEVAKGMALIKRSKNRRKILTYLKKGFKTPSEIAKNTGIDNSHVSKYLKSMKDAKLIVCLNEEDAQGRLHKITELGKEVLKCMQNSGS
jgi:predicted transcriptional regulator